MREYTRGEWYDEVSNFLKTSGIYAALELAHIKPEKLSKIIRQPIEEWEYEFTRRSLRTLLPTAKEVNRLYSFHEEETWKLLRMDPDPVPEVTKLRVAIREFQGAFKRMPSLRDQRLLVEEAKKKVNFYEEDIVEISEVRAELSNEPLPPPDDDDDTQYIPEG